MLRSMNDLRGFIVTTSEGAIAGRVEQFYFDDEKWAVRYLVVETGGWMPRGQVLISPAAIGELNWMVRVVKLTLTREQIENGPDVDTDKPVSRQREEEVMEYYHWPLYWGGPLLWGASIYPAPHMVPLPTAGHPDKAAAYDATEETGSEGSDAHEVKGDTHLRSTKEVIGYYIEAADGPVGPVEDFLVEESSWAIRYVVVDTVNWWPGKKVLASSRWISRVGWAEAKVYLDLERAAIKNAPAYEPEMGLSREYEARLHRHYRRTPYWLQGRRGVRGRRAKAPARTRSPSRGLNGAADSRLNKG